MECIVICTIIYVTLYKLCFILDKLFYTYFEQLFTSFSPLSPAYTC